jgi:hypothetical protein
MKGCDAVNPVYVFYGHGDEFVRIFVDSVVTISYLRKLM